ncbi:helix-turn-helix domain-containing protein [Nonomuraea sp. K274]|uniref:Helix-turn-helix domain-containing protein n=1 Tax=Nonomuraea cypriaca TaxID=1187855 RepID=A0A931AF58_9ACTN|nr:helix-turn-helix domain-containing protein [Nonomuraea cypriaca]MBF8189393.1 helix-turn-helix domain-containing protein [Nonomuraea cypriaca]
MRVRYRAEDVPVSSRFDYWQDIVNESFTPMDLHYDGQPSFSSELTLGRLGQVGVAEVCDRSPGQARGRPSERAAGQYTVFMVTRGRTMAIKGGREVLLGPGQFVVTDPARPYRCVFPARRAVCVAFPKELLPLPEEAVAEVADVPIEGDEGVPALVGSLIARLPGCLDDISGTADGVRLSTALLDLLAVALATRMDRADVAPPPTRTRALLTRIQTYVEERLGDPGLSPARVAEAHHISLRYLYKLFESQGCGVADWIRRRRLERCRRDLLDPALSERPVRATGARWGFPDATRFNRLFRTAYGLPPGEYRRACGLTVLEPAPVPVLEPAPVPVLEPAPVPVLEPAPVPLLEPALGVPRRV